MPFTQSIIHHYSVEKTIVGPQVFISYFPFYIASKHMTVFTITLFPYMNMLYSNAIYVLIYSKRQSGNDARLRTGGSKIEGWNTASHVVNILI